MKPAQIRASVETGKLQLTKSQRFNHFFPAHAAAFIGLMLPAAIVFDLLADSDRDSVISVSSFLAISISSISIAAALYWHLGRVLSLSKVLTPFQPEEAREVLIRLAEREGWSVQNNRKSLVVMKTHPGFTWNWGEKITVLFYDGDVWVNSICDPDYESAIYSSGRNTQNRNLIHQYLTGFRRFSG